VFLDKLFPNSPLFGGHFLTDWHYRAGRKLEVLSGASLLLRTRCLEEVGLLDANYFMYCEDVDWCLRAERAGWDRRFVPEARILHHHGASSRAFRPEMVRIYNASRCYYFMKFFGPDTALDAKRVMVLGARLRQFAWSLLAVRGTTAAKTARQWKEIAEKTAALDLESLPPPGSGEGKLGN
jgi:GT2 family glycosyltransferase